MLNHLQDQLKSFLPKAFLKGTLDALMIRLGGILVLFATTLFLTNFFDAALVGSYELARSFLLLLGSFALLGTDQSVIYFAGYLKRKNQAGAILSVYKKMLVLIILASAAVLTVSVLIPQNIYFFYFGEDRTGPIIMESAAILFFYALTLLNTEVFRALNKINKAEMYRGVFKYLPFGVASLLLYILGEETHLVEAFLLSFVFLAILSSVEVLKLLGEKKSQKEKISDEPDYTSIFKASYPIAISALSFFLLLSIDILFLKKYTGFDTIAYYAAAMKLILLLTTIVNTINAFIAPRIPELYPEQKEQLKFLLRSSVRLIAVLSLPLAILFLIFPKPVLSIFGSGYESASTALLILTAGHFFSSVFGCVAVYMNMTEKQKWLQYILIVTVLLNVFLNWMLVPDMGMNGAAIASAVSVVFWNLVAVILIYKKDRIKIFLT